jgi:hypothetical protein
MSSWAILKIPPTLAWIFGFPLIPEKRIIQGIGLADYFLVMWLLSRLKKNIVKPDASIVKITTILSIISTYLFTKHLHNNYPNFFTTESHILILSILIGLIVWGIMNKKPGITLSLLLLFAIRSSYSVNPVYRGIDVITGTKLSEMVTSVRQNDPDAIWVSYDNLLFANYLIANGIHSLNGTWFYPQFNTLSVLDPQQQNVSLYNRYAQVVFTGTDSIDEITFSQRANAYYTVNINPCNQAFQELGVTYFFFPKEANYRCLRLINQVVTDAKIFSVYQRID